MTAALLTTECESARRAANTTSAPIGMTAKVISQNHDDRITGAVPMQDPIKLTKLRLDALRVAYAAHLKAPGRFVDIAHNGLARGVSGLASLGYLEFVYGATTYGRRRPYAPRYYRLTDAGREIAQRLLPAPHLAEPPAGLLRSRQVSRAQAETIRADIAGYWKDMHILIHADGSTLTLVARYPRDSRRVFSTYSPASYAADLAQRVQMRLQHVAVISADVRPPRIAGHPPKVAIIFRLFEPIPVPLLCAGQGGEALLLLDGGSTADAPQETLQDDVPHIVADWPPEHSWLVSVGPECGFEYDCPVCLGHGELIDLRNHERVDCQVCDSTGARRGTTLYTVRRRIIEAHSKPAGSIPF